MHITEFALGNIAPPCVTQVSISVQKAPPLHFLKYKRNHLVIVSKPARTVGITQRVYL